MRDLYISHVGLSDADLKRFKAVMIAIVSNRDVEARWCMGEATTANLVLVSPDSELTQQFIADPTRKPGQIIAAILGESDSVAFECEKLAWPLRLPGLIDLLKRVEQRIGSADGKTAPESPGISADNKLVQFAQLLRETTPGDKPTWCVSGLSERPVYVSLQDKTFIFEDSLLNLLQVDPNAALELQPISEDQLPEQGQRKPIRMLQWLIGLRSGRMGPLPWVKMDSTFRLRQFPEFQLLHHSSEHRRIAASLSRPRSGIQAIVDASELNAATVVGFLNAASLCGYLKISDAGVPVTAAVKKPSAGSRRGLFQVFRRALGIASNDA